MRHDRIHRDINIMSGQPVIKGTRIPVKNILNEFSVGETEESILEAYPSLTIEDVRAALAWAAAFIDDDRLVEAAE
jgi:uncharacterized protein (DUF433 family)